MNTQHIEHIQVARARSRATLNVCVDVERTRQSTTHPQVRARDRVLPRRRVGRRAAPAEQPRPRAGVLWRLQGFAAQFFCLYFSLLGMCACACGIPLPEHTCCNKGSTQTKRWSSSRSILLRNGFVEISAKPIGLSEYVWFLLLECFGGILVALSSAVLLGVCQSALPSSFASTSSSRCGTSWWPASSAAGGAARGRRGRAARGTAPTPRPPRRRRRSWPRCRRGWVRPPSPPRSSPLLSSLLSSLHRPFIVPFILDFSYSSTS